MQLVGCIAADSYYAVPIVQVEPAGCKADVSLALALVLEFVGSVGSVEFAEFVGSVEFAGFVGIAVGLVGLVELAAAVTVTRVALLAVAVSTAGLFQLVDY